MELYVTTDSNEIKQIFEKRRVKWWDCVRGYNLTIGVTNFEGRGISITNLPVTRGETIRRQLDLSFNPMSVISGDFSDGKAISLIRKLIDAGLHVAEIGGRGLSIIFQINIKDS